MNIKNTLIGMLLLMVATTAITEAGKGDCKGGACALKPNKQKQAQMMQRARAAQALQVQAQAKQQQQALMMQRAQAAKTLQAQARAGQKQEVGCKGGMCALKSKQQQAQAMQRAQVARALQVRAGKTVAKTSTPATGTKEAEVSRAKATLGAKEVTTQEAKSALTSDTPPPLPPKRPRNIAATPISEPQVAQAEQPKESWSEMLSRHASTLASHLGAD